MAKFYTTSPIGFYDDTMYPPPADALPISDDDYKTLFAGQAKGQIIKLDDTGKGLTSGTLPASPSAASLLALQASVALKAGLTVTSTSTPAVNGTYDCTAATLSHIQAEMLSILTNQSFADGGSALDWPDISGTVHIFPNEIVFKDFAMAVARFAAMCAKVVAGISEKVPATSVKIA